MSICLPSVQDVTSKSGMFYLLDQFLKTLARAHFPENRRRKVEESDAHFLECASVNSAGYKLSGGFRSPSPVDDFWRMPEDLAAIAQPPSCRIKFRMLRCPLTPLFLMAGICAASPVDDRWQVREGRGNIELYAQAPLDAASLWREIADVRDELKELLDVSSSGEPVQIMLFRDQASYLRYLTPGIPQARSRKAIYYRNGKVSQIYAIQGRSLITDVRHEMTHALLHQHLPFIPLWLDEGLAEYLEEPASARIRSGRVTAARWKARTGWTPSLKTLEAIPSAEDMDANDYRDSWAWTCFLVNQSPETLQLLRDYLTRIHTGDAPGPFSRFAQAQNPGSLLEAKSYFRKITIRVASDSSRER
jgi:hypothetical protein